MLPPVIWGRNLRLLLEVFYPSLLLWPMSSLEMGKGKWGKSYYDSPWELTADAFGGVQSRFRTNKEVEYGWRYLLECALFAPLAYLFLL